MTTARIASSLSPARMRRQIRMRSPTPSSPTQTVLVLQQEVDVAANAALIARARRASARIVLNAAPAHAVSLDLLRRSTCWSSMRLRRARSPLRSAGLRTPRDFASTRHGSSAGSCGRRDAGRRRSALVRPGRNVASSGTGYPRGRHDRRRRCLRRCAGGGDRRWRCASHRLATWRRSGLACVYRPRRATRDARCGRRSTRCYHRLQSRAQ